MSLKHSPKRDKDTTLIFLHIPKAGGTTLHSIIERQYHKQEIFSIDGNRVQGSIGDFKSLAEHERAKIRCLKGHMWFGLHRYFPQGAMYITILRDPVERVISHYYFVLENPGHYLHETVVSRQMDLEQYVTSGISQELNNWQVKAISGVETVILGQAPVSADSLEVAKRNLRVHFVAIGLLERFDETLLLFKRLFGWNNICYVHRNLTKRRPAKSDISLQTLRTIEKYNELDMKFYEFAEKIFEKKLLEQKIGERQLTAFRLLNAIYALTYNFIKTTPFRSVKRLATP